MIKSLKQYAHKKLSFITLIAELLTQGCIEVCTHPQEKSLRKDKKKIRYNMRTLIQPDGDVICFASPKALDQPGIIQAHQDKVTEILKPLKDFQNLLGQAAWLALLPLVYELLTSGLAGILRGCLQGAAIALALAVFKLVVYHVIGTRTHKAIDKLIHAKRREESWQKD